MSRAFLKIGDPELLFFFRVFVIVSLVLPILFFGFFCDTQLYTIEH